MLNKLVQHLNESFLKYANLPHFNLYQSQDRRDLNIFIGVKGRKEHLVTTLHYFMAALCKEHNFKVRIIIIEHDDVSKLSELAQKFNTEYIFINNAHTNTRKEFSRSLCFNVGYALTKGSEWNLHHDCDLLVPEDFLTKLQAYMRDDVDWIQPYADKRVRRLTPELTRYIINEVENTHYVDLRTVSKYLLYAQGAAGGSLLVRDKAFEAVGGYEEFMFGYSPEDSFLWTKLEAMKGEIGTEYSPHKGFATYVNDIQMYHLDHFTQHWNQTPRLTQMEDLYNCFCNLDYMSKLKYIGIKAEQYKEAMA